MLKSPVYIIFIFLLIFAPLAFGTVEQWSLLIMEALAVFALLMLLAEKKGPGPFYKVPGILPLLCICLYHLVQIMPLPSGLVSVISPATYRLYESAGSIIRPPEWISISVHKKETVAEFFRFISAAAFYVVTVQLLSNKELLKKTVIIVITFSGLLALLSIMQYLVYNEKIYWLRELTIGGAPFGPFVNRNHYAGFMGMVFPLALSIFLFYKPSVSYSSLREKLAELFSRRRTNTYVLTGFASILMAVSVFLSLSRGGIVSLGLSIIFFGLILLARKTGSRRGLVIVILCVLVLLSVSWFGWDPIISRFEKIRNPMGNISDMRPAIWKDTLSMIMDFPVFGTGFGTYIDVYTKYRTLPGEIIVDHAHNDYLELLSDGGLTGFILFCWFLADIFISSCRMFRKRRELYSIYLFTGSVSGIVYMLLHSVTDFNLHIGSNGLYFFFLAGIMVSSANTRLRDGLQPTFLDPLKRSPSPAVLPAVALILTAGLAFNAGGLLGKYYYAPLKEIRLDRLKEKKDLQLVSDAVKRAIMFDLLEPDYRLANAEVEKVLTGPGASLQYYTKAVTMNPLRAEYMQRLGLAYAEAGDFEKADRLLKAAISLDRNASSGYKTYASWLLQHDRKPDGILIIKKALSMDPGWTKEYLTLMIVNSINNKEMTVAMPELAGPHIVFADYLFKTGYDDLAGDEYRKAFDFINIEKEVSPSYFFQASQYFISKKMYDDALAVMRKGVEALPDNMGIRLAFGDIYEKMGMAHKAVEAYEKALVIEPDNKEALGKIDELRKKTGR